MRQTLRLTQQKATSMKQTILFSYELIQKRFISLFEVLTQENFLMSSSATEILPAVAKLATAGKKLVLAFSVAKSHKKVSDQIPAYQRYSQNDNFDVQKHLMLLESSMGLVDDILGRLASVSELLESRSNDVAFLFSADATVKQIKMVKKNLKLKLNELKK